MKKRFVSILLVAAMTASLQHAVAQTAVITVRRQPKREERQRVHLTVVRSHLQSRPSS